MKFKLDENLGSLGKTLLEADGHDVTTLVEQRLRGVDGHRLYEICRDEERVLITLDRDFGLTLRFPPEETAGIVVLDCRGTPVAANDRFTLCGICSVSQSTAYRSRTLDCRARPSSHP